MLQLRQGKYPLASPIEMIIRLALSIPSLVVKNHLFIEELYWEGVAGQMIGPVKAPVIRVILVHLPTSHYHYSHQFQPTMAGKPASSHLPSLSKGLLAYLYLVQLACHRPV